MCGHYTQVTWGATTDVGCGLCFCPSVGGISNAEYIVCNYLPAGNWVGDKNYKRGQACTQCHNGRSFCNNNLCDTRCTAAGGSCACKASCKRCSTQTADCRCKCAPGTAGGDCSETCTDLDNLCNKSPGYPSNLCTDPDPVWKFVKDKCPMMCGVCQARSGNSPACREEEEKELYSLKHLMLDYLKVKLDERDDY